METAFHLSTFAGLEKKTLLPYAISTLHYVTQLII